MQKLTAEATRPDYLPKLPLSQKHPKKTILIKYLQLNLI
jgi:hypothetical protein